MGKIMVVWVTLFLLWHKSVLCVVCVVCWRGLHYSFCDIEVCCALWYSEWPVLGPERVRWDHCQLITMPNTHSAIYFQYIQYIFYSLVRWDHCQLITMPNTHLVPDKISGFFTFFFEDPTLQHFSSEYHQSSLIHFLLGDWIIGKDA